jgi:hypothetical protein
VTGSYAISASSGGPAGGWGGKNGGQ